MTNLAAVAQEAWWLLMDSRKLRPIVELRLVAKDSGQAQGRIIDESFHEFFFKLIEKSKRNSQWVESNDQATWGRSVRANRPNPFLLITLRTWHILLRAFFRRSKELFLIGIRGDECEVVCTLTPSILEQELKFTELRG